MNIYANDLLPEKQVIPIIIIGTGGTGSHLIQKLAMVNETIIRLGYQGIKVYAFDADTISETNIGRQSFSPNKISYPKCQTMIESINQLYGFQWEYYNVEYNETIVKELRFREHHGITISCVDTVKARRAIHKLLLTNDWMDIGNGKNFGQIVFGQVRAYHGKRAHHIFDVYPRMEEQVLDQEVQGPSCSVFEALAKQSLFINTFMATFAADMIKDYILNLYLPYNQLYFNLEEKNINTV
jgi:PRTRC genetic system ThiF family protein